MDYDFNRIEREWQRYWKANETFKASTHSTKPKYYVLDMFPYPSGAGLHVGHPLGYIASDIVARYKRLKGFNVLHPMGYDSFGLPAEQYAIQTGQPPSITTRVNIEKYRSQLDSMGFSFDWSREVRTSDPQFYKWTQWIFTELFNSWYDLETGKAAPITALEKIFKEHGNASVNAFSGPAPLFTATEWNDSDDIFKQKMQMHYRLAFLDYTTVNWCPGLGTVLANEEVKDGFSERGGFPVEQKLMSQWSLRITAYADRLLSDLEEIDWPDAVKEMQRNWIGRSEGALVQFDMAGREEKIEVFTTRADTIFGCTFLVLAPEHPLVKFLTTEGQRGAIEETVLKANQRLERDRMADTTVTGAFTGAFALHPFTGEKIPVWIADYVLAGYGTGAVMAVASGDERDFLFAKHFNLPIVPTLEGHTAEECYAGKEGFVINSGFLNGLNVKQASRRVIEALAEANRGKARVQYRLRDAGFSRQRYWGEPFPVYYKDGMPRVLDSQDLPLTLPEVDAYLPTETGDPPLKRAKNWVSKAGYPLETNTMPGWAGSSWYFFRYMDPQNQAEFASKKALSYWKEVDLYVGGSEHATGHLLYARFWTKFLYDRGYLTVKEPAKKLINQGMIQGRSSIVFKITRSTIYISAAYADKIVGKNDPPLQVEEMKSLIERQLVDTQRNRAELSDAQFEMEYLQSLLPEHRVVQENANIGLISNDRLKNLEEFAKQRAWNGGPLFFILDPDGDYHCGWEVEKMSKSKLNVVNPDDIIATYGADTLRMYEMFLGPIELSKPWNTNGIEGVFKFLKRFWKLFHDAEGRFSVSDARPSQAEFKSLHKIIRKVEEDIERFSLNTSISSFMICLNELTTLKCNKRQILAPLTLVLSPFAPHVCEELWKLLGGTDSIAYQTYPAFDEAYLLETAFNYPISVNGKVKINLDFPLDAAETEIQNQVLSHPAVSALLDGKKPKRFILVKGKIINLVV